MVPLYSRCTLRYLLVRLPLIVLPDVIFHSIVYATVGNFQLKMTKVFLR